MDPRRSTPKLALALFFGNLFLLGSWAVVLMRTQGWQVLGPVLLAGFLVLRVGGMWYFALRHSDNPARSRRAAIFTTALAAVAVGLWFYVLLQGPRSR